MTILNESGIPDALSPLYGVGSVCERLPYVLGVVVGTRSEAHLAQTLSGFPGSPGGATGAGRALLLVLDPEEEPEGGDLATRVVGEAVKFRDAGAVLLFRSRSAELLGVDFDVEARLLERRLGAPVRTVDLFERERDPGSTGGPMGLSTDVEDRALAALVDLCPRETPAEQPGKERTEKERGRLGGLLGRSRGLSLRRGGRNPEPPGSDRKPVALLSLQASLGRGGRSLRELAADLDRAGVQVAGGIPGPAAEEFPALGPGTVAAPLDPYLATAAGAVRRRGAEVVETLMPIGVDGTARFIQDVAEAAGSDVRAGEMARARSVWESLGSLRSRIRGKRVFFTGDTGLEVPLARFLSDAGALVLEVGSPRLDRRLLAPELQVLSSGGVDVIESPEWREQLGRIDEARPDVVVAGPGLHVPLVARGHLCRSSLDFLGAGIHGYKGARRILELFARSLQRAEGLDAVEL